MCEYGGGEGVVERFRPPVRDVIETPRYLIQEYESDVRFNFLMLPPNCLLLQVSTYRRIRGTRMELCMM